MSSRTLTHLQPNRHLPPPTHSARHLLRIHPNQRRQLQRLIDARAQFEPDRSLAPAASAKQSCARSIDRRTSRYRCLRCGEGRESAGSGGRLGFGAASLHVVVNREPGGRGIGTERFQTLKVMAGLLG